MSAQANMTKAVQLIADLANSTLSVLSLRAAQDRPGPGEHEMADTLATIERTARIARMRPLQGPAKKTTRKAAFDREWARIEKVIFARAGKTDTSKGQCEVRTADGLRCMAPAEEGHHCFGRVREKQSELNCIAVCSGHHRDFTRNEPDAAKCWLLIASTLEWLGFRLEASKAAGYVEKAETRAKFRAQEKERRNG